VVTLIPVFADSQGRVIVSGSKSGKVFKKSALLARVREMVARNLCVVAPLLPDIAIASQAHGWKRSMGIPPIASS
jgi:hypothetical protein